MLLRLTEHLRDCRKFVRYYHITIVSTVIHLYNLLLIQLKRIIDIADNNNKQIYCLDLNKNGTPRHPRFFSFKTILNHELIPYN